MRTTNGQISSTSAEADQQYDDTPVKYTAIFHCCKNDNFQLKNLFIFLIFAQNIDFGYTLEAEAVLTSTNNLCFRAKIRKK